MKVAATGDRRFERPDFLDQESLYLNETPLSFGLPIEGVHAF